MSKICFNNFFSLTGLRINPLNRLLDDELYLNYVTTFPPARVHIESNCGTDKKHECEECHQRYLTLASLNAHMIKHAGIKSHLCNFCGASFLNKGQLKVHVRMHTGERPYKCNVSSGHLAEVLRIGIDFFVFFFEFQQCDKAFAHRESLITHSTTHSGIKPYYCSYCQSRFSCIGRIFGNLML